MIVYTGRVLSPDEEQRLRRYSRSIIIKGAKSPERLVDEVTLFLHSVESALPPEQQRMLRAARQRDDVFEGRTILLAEDDVRNIFALSHVIEPLGAKLEIARNGREALDSLARHPQIDLVLMDIMMPEMDGLTAMTEIRKNPDHARLPIIALDRKSDGERSPEVPGSGRGRLYFEADRRRQAGVAVSSLVAPTIARSAMPHRTLKNTEEAIFDIELKLLLEAVYLKYQHDFRHYSVSSLRRRLTQALHDLGFATLSQLQERILRDATLFSRLFQYLTVQVSEMFRDPAYFRSRPGTGRADPADVSVHQGVGGGGAAAARNCGSLAILFAEENIADRTVLYATDINADALRQAENGIYPLDRLASFSQNYLAAGGKRSLSDYYHAAYGAAKFSQTLKSRVVFADHSLATDSVFLEAHLVSCRNVLIYFDRALQDRALGLFSDSLVRRGLSRAGQQRELAVLKTRRQFRRFRCARAFVSKGLAMTPPTDPLDAIDAIVIGASAGGIEALNHVLARAPGRFPPCRAGGAACQERPAQHAARVVCGALPVAGRRARRQGQDRRRHDLCCAAGVSHAGRAGLHRSPFPSIRPCGSRGHRWMCCLNRRHSVSPIRCSASCSPAPTTTAHAAWLRSRGQAGAAGCKTRIARWPTPCRLAPSRAAACTTFSRSTSWSPAWRAWLRARAANPVDLELTR